MAAHDDLLAAVRDHLDAVQRVERLVAAIRPSDDLAADPCRYHCVLGLLAGGQPPPPSAGEVRAAERARERLLSQARALAPNERLRALRALAILHWEWALALGEAIPLSAEARSCYQFANRLWRLLLTDEGFWLQFAAEHDVVSAHLPAVREEVLGDLLGHHLERMKACFGASDCDGARFHAACLGGWSERPDSPLADRFSPAFAGAIHAEAESLTTAWVSDLLRRATEQLDDAQALQGLPQGISRDFTGALEAIQPALDIVPDNLRLLAFAVRQRNDYAYELAVADRREEAHEAIEQGCVLARRLAEKHLAPGQPLNAENQAVSLAFKLASRLERDPSRGRKYLEECERWGGSSEQLEFQILRQRAHEAIDQKDYEQALESLDTLEAQSPGHHEVRELRALCCHEMGYDTSRRADELRARLAASPELFLRACRGAGDETFETVDELYRRALTHLRRAAELAPKEDAIRETIAATEKARREAPLHAAIDAAREVLEGEAESCYDAVLNALESVPADFDRAPEAARTRAALLSRTGAAAADAGRFDEAEGHLRKAVDIDPSDELTRSRLAALYLDWAYAHVADARKCFERVGGSAAAFLREDGVGFKSIRPAAVRAYQQAREKLRKALAEAPESDRAAVRGAMDELGDPRDLYWEALLSASGRALAGDELEHYSRLAQLLRKCPAGHRDKDRADALAERIRAAVRTHDP